MSAGPPQARVVLLVTQLRKLLSPGGRSLPPGPPAVPSGAGRGAGLQPLLASRFCACVQTQAAVLHAEQQGLGGKSPAGTLGP